MFDRSNWPKIVQSSTCAICATLGSHPCNRTSYARSQLRSCSSATATRLAVSRHFKRGHLSALQKGPANACIGKELLVARFELTAHRFHRPATRAALWPFLKFPPVSPSGSFAR